MSLKSKVKNVDVEKEAEEILNLRVAKPKKEKKCTTICLRIPVDLLNEMDELVENGNSPTRTYWIWTAIREKIKRECK